MLKQTLSCTHSLSRSLALLLSRPNTTSRCRRRQYRRWHHCCHWQAIGNELPNELQCIAVHCSALQCIAVHCSVRCERVAIGNELQCIAVHCSALQCIAVCCSVNCCSMSCSAFSRACARAPLRTYSLAIALLSLSRSHSVALPLSLPRNGSASIIEKTARICNCNIE